MLLSSKIQEQLYSCKSARRLHAILSPKLGWLRKELSILDLEKDEIESEIFILTANLFHACKKSKYGLVSCLKKQLDWQISSLLKHETKVKLYFRAESTKKNEPINHTQSEFYLKIPSILLENRYLGRALSRSDRYLIYRILVADDDQLSHSALARHCKVSRQTLRKKLSDLADKLQDGGFHGGPRI
jgi:hypothetical protein